MDNGMDNMLDMYLFETNSLLDQLDELLIDAEKSGDFSADNVNEIFRIMHTVKGSSAMMEFSSLMTIAHQIEDLFFYIRENGFSRLTPALKRELFDLMFRSNDYLRAEVSKVENNKPLSDDIGSFTSDIKSFLDKISGQELAEAAPGSAAAHELHTDGDSGHAVLIFFDDSAGMENLRAFMLMNSLKDAEIPFTCHPSNPETDESAKAEITENGFMLYFQNEAAVNTAVAVIKGNSNVRSYEILTLAQNQEVKESPASETIAAKPAASIAKPATVAAAPATGTEPAVAAVTTGKQMVSKQNLINVNLSKLDSLMAIVGEIVITESMVTSSPELKNLKLDSFLKSSRQLRNLTDELQDIAMSLRMVSVSGVFQKMNRIVRDMSQQLHKDVHLVINGEDTEVDKTIVDTIGDPIMHIVRNAMDHGIESDSKSRTDAGKPAYGTITLSASHTGSEVVITVKDDGQGMDTDAILAKAARNGILTKPESEYSKREILNLLMLPGFSTNENVTEFSGRGVGMDVVKKNVESVGGTVTITSEFGQGSCVTLKIPLTLAIMDGMEISVGSSIFTIPIANIHQTFKITHDEIIHDSEGGEIVERTGIFYPVIRLHTLYNIETNITNLEDGILVWVEAADKSYCLFLDELLGEQQVVVKPLPVFLNNFNIKHSGITGCTILGDGNISIILDIPTLYDVAHN